MESTQRILINIFVCLFIGKKDDINLFREKSILYQLHYLVLHLHYNRYNSKSELSATITCCNTRSLIGPHTIIECIWIVLNFRYTEFKLSSEISSRNQKRYVVAYENL